MSELQVQKPPFSVRFKAWWEGYELRAARAKSGGDSDETTSEMVREAKFGSKIEARHLLWGEGFEGPGGSDFWIDLAVPFGLTEKNSMLFLGAGLGGAPRALAKEFGVWITGYEGDQEYCETGVTLSAAAGLSKKVEILKFEPGSFELKTERFDTVFAKETLGFQDDAKSIIGALLTSLRPAGHFFAAEFCVADDIATDSAFAQWQQIEPRAENLVTVDELEGIITHVGLDLRVARDITELFLQQLTRAWANCGEVMEIVASYDISDEIKRDLLTDLHRWTLCADLMMRKKLMIYTMHAIKPTVAIK